jgi:hypothetical protein
VLVREEMEIHNLMEHSPYSEANSRSYSQEIPPPFMVREDLLSWSQEPATGPYSEPEESSP